MHPYFNDFERLMFVRLKELGFRLHPISFKVGDQQTFSVVGQTVNILSFADFNFFVATY